MSWATVVQGRKCPFVDRPCIKTRKSDPGVAIGTCSVLHGKDDHLIVICPLRFLQKDRVFVDCLHLLSRHEPGNELHAVSEMTVPGGNIDYILVSARNGQVADFVGIELQALDTTGTVWPARQRFLSSVGVGQIREDDVPRRSYGMNWKMTAKTILMQLHHKIRTFEAIGKKLVLVVQDHLLRYLHREFNFSHIEEIHQNHSMYFHAYELKLGTDGDYDLQLRRRASTDAEGIAACLGLKAEPDMGLEKIIRQLEDRMSDRTRVRMIS